MRAPSGTKYQALPMALVALFGAGAAEAASPAFSGIAATADSAETAFSNPAGMSRLEDSQWSVQLMLAQTLGEFEVDERQTSTAGGNPEDDSTPIFIPFFYYVRPLDERWRAGISLTVPNGFGADYGGEWAGRYYSDYFTLVYVALTPALSYRVSDQLSLGVAVNINYTLSETEVAINNLAPGVPDGRLESELDGIGTGVSVSALWEFDARTRAGLVYTSEAQADLEGDLKLKQLGSVLGQALAQQGLLDTDVEVENTLPQRVVGGVYHQMESGHWFTIDALWMQFSEFGTTAVSLNGSDLEVDEGGTFDDIWGVAIGYGFPTAGRFDYSLGAFYLSAPVDDDKRSLALALDRMWAIGAGVSFARCKDQQIELNLNLVDYGKAPVDTGGGSARGRVVGETEDPYAIMLDAAWHF